MLSATATFVFFPFVCEETPDTNSINSHAPSTPIQGLNSGRLIQESVDGWLTTQSGQNLASSAAHELDSNLDEDRQIEVLA